MQLTRLTHRSLTCVPRSAVRALQMITLNAQLASLTQTTRCCIWVLALTFVPLAPRKSQTQSALFALLDVKTAPIQATPA